MEEWKAGAEDGDGDGDGETLLPRHEIERLQSHSDEGSDDGYRGRKSVKGVLWVVLATATTVTGRRLFRDDFPYPIYFLLLLQIIAYCVAAIVVAALQLNTNLRDPKRTSEAVSYTFFERMVVGVRLFISACFSAVAMVFAAEALMWYNNLCVVALLPILTFVSDSFILRFLHCFRITRQEKVNIEWGGFWRVFLVSVCAFVVVIEDYRLEERAVYLALSSCVLFSCAKAVTKIGPRYEKSPPTWDTPFYVLLLVGVPFIFITGNAAGRYEDLVAAGHAAYQWSNWTRLLNFGPGVALYILFASSLNSSYPFVSRELAGGPLEDRSEEAQAAVRGTLHTTLWVIVIGAFGKEYSLIDWFQAIAFTFIYVVSVGPKHLGYYPPRFLNLFVRLFRRKPILVQPEPWQFPVVLVITTTVFSIILSTNSMYFISTASYNRDLKTWLGPTTINADTMYRPPVLRSFDIVIAHSAGDPIEHITTLLNSYTTIGSVAGFDPKVKIYTKDQDLDATDTNAIRGSFGGDISIQTLRNTGGVTATYLHHILYAWEFMAQQSLFLSTSPESIQNIDLQSKKMHDYFIPADFPLPDASPKTGFLHLGDHSVCSCSSCTDATGWEDSFHLIPSMWGAARQRGPPEGQGGKKDDAGKCESVLLTHGNEWAASAARIRGVKRDIWQLLYDALVKEDVNNSWAHAREKLPVKLPWQGDVGRWDPGEVVRVENAEGENGSGSEGRKEIKGGKGKGIYGLEDSLESPWLGYTVERLWGVLLQCSNADIAWKCPGNWRGWRLGGRREDCMCVD